MLIIILITGHPVMCLAWRFVGDCIGAAVAMAVPVNWAEAACLSQGLGSVLAGLGEPVSHCGAVWLQPLEWRPLLVVVCWCVVTLLAGRSAGCALGSLVVWLTSKCRQVPWQAIYTSHWVTLMVGDITCGYAHMKLHWLWLLGCRTHSYMH